METNHLGCYPCNHKFQKPTFEWVWKLFWLRFLMPQRGFRSPHLSGYGNEEYVVVAGRTRFQKPAFEGVWKLIRKYKRRGKRSRFRSPHLSGYGNWLMLSLYSRRGSFRSPHLSGYGNIHCEHRADAATFQKPAFERVWKQKD